MHTYPCSGHPSGVRSSRLKRVNSCSKPNQGISSSVPANCFSAIARELVGSGSPEGVYVSHMTRILSTPSDRGRNGSRKIRQGLKITSESSPGACPVEDPSKFHLGSVSTDAARSTVKVRVFDLQFPTASTQTYSANTLSEGNGNASNFAITAGSRADFPVDLVSTTLSVVDVRDGLDGVLNAVADEKMHSSKGISENFILW